MARAGAYAPATRGVGAPQGQERLPLHHAPARRGAVTLSAASHAAARFPHLAGRILAVLPAPPYLDTTPSHEDHWLRVWGLGGVAPGRSPRGDGRHHYGGHDRTVLTEAGAGLAPLLADTVRLV